MYRLCEGLIEIPADGQSAAAVDDVVKLCQVEYGTSGGKRAQFQRSGRHRLCYWWFFNHYSDCSHIGWAISLPLHSIGEIISSRGYILKRNCRRVGQRNGGIVDITPGTTRRRIAQQQLG